MNISALIERLSKIKEEHGDLPVTCNVIYDWESVDEGDLDRILVMKRYNSPLPFKRVFLEGGKIL